MKKPLRIAIVVAGVLGMGALLAGSLQEKPTRVQLEAITRGPLQITVQGSGTTRFQKRFLVSAPVSGNLSRIALRAGDPVESGQELAQLTPAAPELLSSRTRAELSARIATARAAQEEAKAQLSQSQVALEQAERDLIRTRKLVASGSLPPSAEETADTDLKSRRAALSVAEHSVERVRREMVALSVSLSTEKTGISGPQVSVASPSKGVILRVLQEHAGPVPAGAQLLELADPRSLEIRAELVTQDAVRVRPGASATITGYGLGRPLQARVDRVEPSAFTKITALGVEEQRVNVILKPLMETGWQLLGDGFHVESRVVLEEVADAVRVPNVALVREGERWSVFAVENRRAQRRSVSLGRRSEDLAEVLDGLVPGGEVVAFPSDAITAGVLLSPEPSR